MLASVLTAIDNQLDSLQNVLGAATQLRTAIIEDYLSSAAGPATNSIRLSEGCLRITDGTHSSPEFVNEGVPFFLVKTISSGRVDWSNTKFVGQDTYEELTRRIKPQRGDVLYTAVGSYGVALLVDFDQPFVFQRHIAHIVPDPRVLTGRYIEIYLSSRYGKRQSDRAAIGSAQPTVTLGSLGKFTIPALSLIQQQELEARARDVDQCLSATESRRKSLKATRAAILADILA